MAHLNYYSLSIFGCSCLIDIEANRRFFVCIHAVSTRTPAIHPKFSILSNIITVYILDYQRVAFITQQYISGMQKADPRYGLGCN